MLPLSYFWNRLPGVTRSYDNVELPKYETVLEKGRVITRKRISSGDRKVNKKAVAKARRLRKGVR